VTNPRDCHHESARRMRDLLLCFLTTAFQGGSTTLQRGETAPFTDCHPERGRREQSPSESKDLQLSLLTTCRQMRVRVERSAVVTGGPYLPSFGKCGAFADSLITQPRDSRPSLACPMSLHCLREARESCRPMRRRLTRTPPQVGASTCGGSCKIWIFCSFPLRISPRPPQNPS